MARPELRDRRRGWGGGLLNASTILLQPLSTEEADVLLAELLGDEQLDGPVRMSVRAAAEGNPLFLEEMLAMLHERGEREVRVPPTIQALLAARIDQLDEAERAVLERGAIEGTTFHRGAVEALAPEERDLSARLTALIRKDLVHPDRSTVAGDSVFRFRHALLREAAYDALPKAVRADLHERFAAWLDAQGHAVAERDELVGHHLEQAVRYRRDLGTVDGRTRQVASAAAARLADAGGRALDRGDISAAVSLLERAAELRDPDDPVRRELLTELGTALSKAGDLKRAAVVLAEAAHDAEAAGDRRLAALVRMEQAYLSVPTGGELRAALSEAQAAADMLRGFGDDDGAARAERLAGNLLFWLGNCAGAEQAWRRAQEQATGRDETEALALLTVVANHGPTPAEDVIRLCDAIVERSAGRRSLEAQALLSSGAAHAMRGRFDTARAAVRQALAIWLELGARLDWAGGAMQAARVELLAGDAAAAELVGRDAYNYLDRAGERGYLSSLAPRLALALFLQGRLDEAEHFTRVSETSAASDDASPQIEWRALRARVQAARGRPLEEAEAHARGAVEIASHTDLIGEHAGALVALAEVLRAAGRADDGVLAAEAALRLYEQKGNLILAAQARDLLGDLVAAAVSKP